MHEVALAQGIVEIVSELALRERFSRVRVVRVEVGVLANVMPEALAAGFEAAALGTKAQGARLDLLPCPGRAWCLACSVDVEAPSRLATCPHCNGSQLIVSSGEQLRVLDLEVD